MDRDGWICRSAGRPVSVDARVPVRGRTCLSAGLHGVSVWSVLWGAMAGCLECVYLGMGHVHRCECDPVCPWPHMSKHVCDSVCGKYVRKRPFAFCGSAGLSAGWSGAGPRSPGWQGWNDGLYGLATSQEPETCGFRNFYWKTRNEEVSKVSVGFYFKEHKVTFAHATWICCCFFVPFLKGGGQASFAFPPVVFIFKFC